MIDSFRNPNTASNLFINSVLDFADILKYANSLPKENNETTRMWDLFIIDWCKKYQHVIQLFVAIGTIGSVIVSLWLALRPKKSDIRGIIDIGVEIDNLMTPADNEDLGSPTIHKFLYANVYNHSDWDVLLKNYSFSVVLFFGKIYSRDIVTLTLKNFSENPLNIKPRSYAVFHNDLDIFDNFIDIALKENKFVNKCIRFCILWVPFITLGGTVISAIEEEFKLKLSEQLINIVKNRISISQKFYFNRSKNN